MCLCTACHKAAYAIEQGDASAYNKTNANYICNAEMGISMNDAVIPELQLLLFSVIAGSLCFFGYDLLLVSRVFLKRPLLIEKAEDVLYWCAASILVFSMIHQKNSGVIRGYSIAGMLTGMILYRIAAKERLVSGAEHLAKKIGAWVKRRLEPLRKKRLQLQNKRKQAKIDRKKRQQALREAKQAKRAEKAKKKKQGKQAKKQGKQTKKAEKKKQRKQAKKQRRKNKENK